MIPTKKVKTLTPYSYTLNDQHKQIIKLVKETHADRPLKLVVSVTEADELKGKGFISVKSMVSPADWKAEGVSHHLLSMKDQTKKVSNDEAIETIIKMRQCIKSGGTVYIHCKAGRSRSIMMCAIYLSVFGTDPSVDREMAFDDVKALLKEKRSQMDFDSDKIAKAKEIIQEVKNRVRRQVNIKFLDATPKMLNTIMQYLYVFDEEHLISTLKSQKLKSYVNNLPVLNKLRSYVREPKYSLFSTLSTLSTFSTPKIDVLANFLNLLREDNNDRWFFELMNPAGLLSTFVHEDKKEINDRESLIKNLQTVVVDYICEAMSCEKQDLLNYLQGYQHQLNKKMIDCKQKKT